MSSSLTERIVPITILEEDDEKGGALLGRRRPCIKQKEKDSSSEKQSLPLTADETTTEIDGLVAKLQQQGQQEALKIEEIKEKSPPPPLRDRFLFGEAAGNGKITSGESDSSLPPPPPLEEAASLTKKKSASLQQQQQKFIAPEETVRLVPIQLSDGRLLQKDPDETMEIKTEFTNYCHQEFSPSKTPSPVPPATSPAAKQPPKERIVPITLDSGEKFMPTFTRLDDIEPPDWSAFSPKNNRGGKAKETVVPIRQLSSNAASTSSSREESPIRSTNRRATSRQSREKMTKSHEKRVQHTVRFVDDDDEEDESKKRSSSLDGRVRFARGNLPPKSSLASSNGRERHRSGGGVSSDKNKTLHEIDRDINKIWRELQELDAVTTSSRPLLPPATAPVAAATPVKIRTFTTPTPASIVGNGGSHTPPPPSSSGGGGGGLSQRTIFDEEYSPSTRSSYHPRRDLLEPTKPGSITPVYVTVTKTTTAATDSKVIISSPKMPATVLQKQEKEAGNNNNNNGGVEFYPKFGTRPRAESLVRRQQQEQLQRQQQSEGKSESDGGNASLVVEKAAAAVDESYADKACQTEDDEAKKRKNAKGKCSVQ